MNIIAETKQNLTEAFKHYVCIRMHFRSSVLKASHAESDRRLKEYCPTHH